MKPQFKRQKDQGINLIEILVIIAALAILAAVLLPVFAAANRVPQKINCISNIKQANLAFRIWEGDNNNLYPMGVSTSIGGGREFILSGDVADCFRVVSNELSTTKILVCPEDHHRAYASNFEDLNNSNISYFFGIDATDEVNPNLVLIGDDNLELNDFPVKSGLLRLPANAPLGWTSGRHVYKGPHFWSPKQDYGNIGFADGTATEVSASGLQSALQKTGLATNRLAIP